MKFYIYKIANPNNEVFIGSTNNPCKRRSQCKANSLPMASKLSNSIKEWGWNDHKWEVIEDSLCETDLLDRKIYWINYFDSFNNGLNQTKGGRGTIGFKWNEESRKKLRDFKIKNK